MKSMKMMMTMSVLAMLTTGGLAMADEHEHDHFDISPYYDSTAGALLVGGLTHDGEALPPSQCTGVFGYEFGEDAADPFNPSDPGVNQAAGVGNLPSGAPIKYNVLSSLMYWDGAGDVAFEAATGTHIELWMGTNMRTLTGTSGPQAGSLIQSVSGTGVVHKHFVTSLWADGAASNVPGDVGYVEPTTGIYAFSIELTMATGGTTYTSQPLWLVFNNGMSEEIHDAAMESFAVPEPMTLAMLAIGTAAVIRRRAH